jgi:hypothetical protein
MDGTTTGVGAPATTTKLATTHAGVVVGGN